MDGYKLEWMGK